MSPRCVAVGFLIIGFLVPCLARAECASVPAGLVGWWKLDGDGTDVTGFHDGTVVGGSFVPAVVGQGFRPNGVGTLVEVPDQPALNPSDFTIDLWARVDSLTDYNLALFWKGNAAGTDLSSPFGLGVYGTVEIPSRTGQPFLTVGNGASSQELDGGVVVPLGVFFHLAATADATTLSLYLDGVLIASTPRTVTSAPSTHPVQIAGVANPGALNLLVGVTDEVELHNVPASAEEILAIYRAGSEGKCQHPTPVEGSSWGRLKAIYR